MTRRRYLSAWEVQQNEFRAAYQRERRRRIARAALAWLVVFLAAIGLLFLAWVALVAWLGVL